MLDRIQTLLQSANDHTKIDILRNYLHSYILLARHEDGNGIMIYDDNLDTAASLIDITKLEAIGLTHCTQLKTLPVNPINRLFMNEIDTNEYYSPKTSGYPLISILRKRALEQGDIAVALERYKLEDTDSISEINEWLTSKGLSCYRFIKFNDYRSCKRNGGYNTIVDSVIIGHIGHHYIWIKNLETYYRPEIDVLYFDVEQASKDDSWSRLLSYEQKCNKVFTVAVHGATTTNGPIPYMISVYPGNTFINFDSVKELILEFLNWINDVMNTTNTIILVGFMNSLFDIPLITAYWPNNCGWKIYNNTLISGNGSRVIWIDAYRFSCGLSLHEYCYNWGSKPDNKPIDLIKKSDAKRRIKSLVKESTMYLKSLFTAYDTQFTALDLLLSPCKLFSFSSIEDMFLTSSIYNASKNVQIGVYHPANEDTKRFISSSICLDYIMMSDFGNKSYYKYTVKSIIELVSSKQYPFGRPRYVKRGTEGKLYIALCKVTLPNKDYTPVICYDDDFESFDAVLTSVDIETAIRSGYRIIELGAIQWEETIPNLKEYIYDNNKMMNELSTYTANKLAERLIRNIELDTENSLILPFYTFAISYCRSYIHNIIKSIDKKYILQYNYKEIYVSDRYKLINNEYLSCSMYMAKNIKMKK
ncbi:IEV protein [NY_014 poxvirus]|uniref:IEV protein n=1 Tax=NY_014 poxvirus TaxID=2025360 RepID=UPI000B9A0019|nr:IEV protein [NY_014 poxvirus]AST09443.1 IEV protein [NY_014 poxvirus]